MAKNFFAESPLLAYPLVAMVLFMFVFLVIAWRTWRRDPAEYDALAQLPFTDDRVPTEGREP
jgi:cbb3-type cytochrome oxidase subunit 3